MPLTEFQIRSLAPREKPYKVTDGGGLHLLVQTSGSRLWRWIYRVPGSRAQKTLALGVFPAVSLKDARLARDAARVSLAAGIDPAVARRASKGARGGEGTFEAVAREWHARQIKNWCEQYTFNMLSRFQRDVFPWPGARPIVSVHTPQLLVYH